MTPEQLYTFDVQGYVVLPNVIPTELVSKLNYYADLISDGSNVSTSRYDHLLDSAPVFRSLIDLVDLKPLFGDRPYRVDHDYLQTLRSGSIANNFHGGATPHDPSQFHAGQDKKIWSGLVAIAFNLTDVNPNDGGFACIPGSHKATFELPPERQSISVENPLMTVVGGLAGSALVFTEAITHASFPWSGEGDRRTYFIKYSPLHQAWSKYRYKSFSHPMVVEPGLF